MHLSEAVFLSWATAASECPGGGWGDMCLAAALRKGYGGREAGRQREGQPCRVDICECESLRDRRTDREKRRTTLQESREVWSEEGNGIRHYDLSCWFLSLRGKLSSDPQG